VTLILYFLAFTRPGQGLTALVARVCIPCDGIKMLGKDHCFSSGGPTVRVCGGQYASMAPLFEHYGIQLWTPAAGGRVDFSAEGPGHGRIVAHFFDTGPEPDAGRRLPDERDEKLRIVPRHPPGRSRVTPKQQRASRRKAATANDGDLRASHLTIAALAA
jgi:hypothetical protein